MVVLEYHIFNIQQIGGSNVYTSANGGTHTGDWNYNLQFRAVDAVGNAGAWTGAYNVKIDKTPPSMTSVTGTFGSWVRSLTIGIAGSDNLSGVSSYQYSTGGAWVGCSTSVGCGAGDYWIYFRCFDAAGNVSAQVGPYSVYVDNIAPVLSTLKINKKNSSTREVDFEIAFTDSGGSGLKGVATLDYFISFNSSKAKIKSNAPFSNNWTSALGAWKGMTELSKTTWNSVKYWRCLCGVLR